MGVVVAATLVESDGRSRQLDDWSLATSTTTREQVEYRYAYGPELVPPAAPSDNGMWRYRDLLPLEDGGILYPLAVGGTPLVASPRLRALSGCQSLWLKDETRTPTGSNKDRATALVLEQALRHGVRAVSCASTGNVGVSLAVGAAAADIRAVIFVPADVRETKLQLMLLAGATVIRVRRGYDVAFGLSRQAAKAFGWYDRNTGVNPLTLEAKKTVALEIWEQLGREAPDAVLAPVGDGVTLAALVKGFRELRACGALDRLPRFIGVQAEGCQPLARAWRGGESPNEAGVSTIADGIAVGVPFSAAMVLRDLRETGGGFVAVPDQALLQAIQTLAACGGILAEPAGAAAFAGLGPALSAGLIAPDERIVALVSGTGLKNMQYLRTEAVAFEVLGDLHEVQRLLAPTSQS